jgi:hypothetical protein
MIRRDLCMMAIVVCVVSVLRSDEVATNDRANDLKTIEGFWVGSWGGGVRDGVVFQPAVAELFIEGDHVEMHGFRDVMKLKGTIRLDASAKHMHLTPSAEPGGDPAPQAIGYGYRIKADELTLIGNDKQSVTLQRLPAAKNALANAELQLVAANEIDDAGDLLVTEFTEIRAVRKGTTYYRPENRSLHTRQATVLLVQETGSTDVTVAEARALIRESTPVAVMYRHDDRAEPQPLHELWNEIGPPSPDGDAVRKTLSRVLRPGTLVFILSAHENIPVP